MEDKFMSIILSELHVYLLLAIIAIIYLLKSMRPVRELLWGTPDNPSKYKWTVTLINVAVSFTGVFLLGMTEFQTTNMMVIASLMISAVATFSYELLIKHLEELVKKKVVKRV